MTFEASADGILRKDIRGHRWQAGVIYQKSDTSFPDLIFCLTFKLPPLAEPNLV